MNAKKDGHHGNTVGLFKLFNELTHMTNGDRIEKLLESRLSTIAQAATRGDVLEITRLTKDATELEAMLKADRKIAERVVEFERASERSDTPDPGVTNTGAPNTTRLRVLPIQVTEGMIKQNLLTFTPHVKQKRIRVGEDLFIESHPSGERFRTVLMQPGNKLQERGAIARFYKDASVRPNDFVEMIEHSPQQWTLRKAESGRYIGKQGWTAEQIQQLLR